MPFFVAIALALVLTWAARRVGLAVGLVDRPAAVQGAGPDGQDPLKIHSRPIPVLGGLGVMCAALVTVVALDHGLPLPVTAGVVLATAIGLVDDARPQPASRRLAVLAVAGVLLAVGLPTERLGWVARPGVVVLLLLLSNAVNLIDGQDGLAGGLGAIASAGLAAVIAPNGTDPLLAVIVAGALVGFLAWNLPPARVFLGNGGAYGLGALLTVLAAQTTAAHGWHGLLAAALCLAVFAFELTFTVVRRLVMSQGLAHGDRKHSYDLLGRSRGNRDRSTMVLWTLGAVSAGAGYAADQVSLAAAVTMLAVAAVIGTAAGGRLWHDAVAVGESAHPEESQ